MRTPASLALYASIAGAVSCHEALVQPPDAAFDAAPVADRSETASDANPADLAVADAGPAFDAPADSPDGSCPAIVRDASSDRSDAPPGLSAPRLLFPLSTNRVTSQRPTLRWQLPEGATGARVELCRDRACARPIATLTVTGSSVRPETALAPGVVFWRATSIRGTALGVERSPTWEFLVGHRDAPIDTAWGTLHDFNGDGYDDLAAEALYVQTGRIYIYHGSADGLQRMPARVLRSPDDVVREFGFRLLPAGDVNGDGFADLVVSENPYVDTTGRFMLFLGGPSGLSERPNQIIYFRDCLSTSRGPDDTGDVNGDGFTDVLTAGAQVDLYEGSPDGLAVYPGSRFPPTTVLGSHSILGDVNGDGFADLAEWTDDGRVVLRQGGADGINPSLWVTYRGASGRAFKYPSSAGDADGDGVGDFVLTNPGVLNIFRGNRSGEPEFVQQILQPSLSISPGEFGRHYSVIGDVNHDGRPDLLTAAITAPANPNTRIPGLGQAYLFLGRSEGGFSMVPTSRSRWKRAGMDGSLGPVLRGNGTSMGTVGTTWSSAPVVPTVLVFASSLLCTMGARQAWSRGRATPSISTWARLDHPSGFCSPCKEQLLRCRENLATPIPCMCFTAVDARNPSCRVNRHDARRRVNLE